MANKTTKTSATVVCVPVKGFSKDTDAGVRLSVNVTVRAFQLDMLIKDETAAKSRKEKRLAGDSVANLSELKIEALREEIKELEASIKAHEAELKKLEAVRNTVVSDLIEAGADKTCAENLFRTLACYGKEYERLSKYALRGVCTTWTPELDKAMTAVHSLKFNDSGAPVMGKTERDAYRTAKNVVKEAVRAALRVPENKYFGELPVNLNNTDIGALHESYVVKVGLKYTEDKKTGASRLCSDPDIKSRVRKPRGKNTEIDASGFWAVAASRALLHLVETV